MRSRNNQIQTLRPTASTGRRRTVSSAVTSRTIPGQAAFLALLTGLALPPSAQAQHAEFCVSCTGPKAVYKCRIDDPGAVPSDALKLYCVTRTTKEANHGSCTANIDTACPGALKTLTYDGVAAKREELESQFNQIKKRIDAEQRKFAAPSERPGSEPKTLMDLTNRMFGGAKTRLGYGEEEETPTAPPPSPRPPAAAAPASPSPETAVRPAPPAYRHSQSAQSDESWASRSYRCMRSFFRDCGSQDGSAAN